MYCYILWITFLWYWKSLLANFLIVWKLCPEILFLNLNLTMLSIWKEWTAMKFGFHHQTIKKEKIGTDTGCLIINVISNTWFKLALTFSSLSNRLIWNTKLVQEVAFLAFKIEKSRVLKLLHVTIRHNESLAPYFGCWTGTYKMWYIVRIPYLIPYNVITAVSILHCYGERKSTLGGELGAEHVIRRLSIPNIMGTACMWNI